MSDRIKRQSFEELDTSLRDALRERVERLGYLGEFFQCAGAQPAILAPFIAMTEALKKALPDRLTETGALTVATLMDNRYELHQHEKLSRKLGFGSEWVAAVERLEPDTVQCLADDERVVQRLVMAMIVRNGRGVSGEVEQTIDAIGPERTIAVMFLVGRYLTHAMIVNGLDLAPPVPSIFEEGMA